MDAQRTGALGERRTERHLRDAIDIDLVAILDEPLQRDEAAGRIFATARPPLFVDLAVVVVPTGIVGLEPILVLLVRQGQTEEAGRPDGVGEQGQIVVRPVGVLLGVVQRAATLTPYLPRRPIQMPPQSS